jgi:hypothetical protein
MSAPVLTVDRLTATVRLNDSGDGTGRRVDALLREVAATRLARAWSQVDLPPGHWCLRRLRLDLEIDPGRGDLALGEEWARALVSSIEAAVRQGSGEVVHYRQRLAALADAVAQLAMGRHDRAWAWAQIGVLARGGPDPASAPGPAALAALLASPDQIVPALVTAVRRCGLAALDRAVGAHGWRQLAQCLWATAGGRAVEPLPALDGPTAPAPASQGPGPKHPRPVGPTGDLPAPPTVLAASELAAAIGRSRLAPPAPVLDAWAVLVALELDPVLPRRPLAVRQLGRVRTALAGAMPARAAANQTAPADRAPGPAGAAGAPPAAGTAFPAPGPRPRDLSPQATAGPTAPPGVLAELSHWPPGSAPAEPGQSTPLDGAPPLGRPTGWAGLPFLLATAAGAGLPDRLLDDPAVGTRPLAWCLHAVGQAITGAPGDDPGLLALAGLHGARAAAIATAPPPDDAEQAALDQVTRDWVAMTAARLVAASTGPAAGGPWDAADPLDVVTWLVRRPGRVVAEPGWIEVHLPLHTVDLAIRRAGLDADPGWVGWLGTVVRFVYA